MKPVLVIDNGGANLASLQFALERIGIPLKTSSDPDELLQAERAILPGVGAAGDAMRRLRNNGMVDALREFERPLLGICLGLQLLFERSSEGNVDGLGLLRGDVSEFAAKDLPVPHMGWNQLVNVKVHPVLESISSEDWFYFVHGFRAPLGGDTLAACEYGETFTAVAGRDNIIAAQFHPERSGTAGVRLLDNFTRWSP